MVTFLSLINRIKRKIYYDILLPGYPNRVAKIPVNLLNTKNIFIYFDYEREFGNPNSEISCKDIDELLMILKNNNILATWFSVGKLFKEYPESFNKIVKNGHEIGSHTYSHEPPFYLKNNHLDEDFKKFSANKGKIIINGFHAPQDKWNIGILDYLVKYEFTYFITKKRSNESVIPKSYKRDKLLRIYSYSDDWLLYQEDSGYIEKLNYLISIVSCINKGEVVGIGFHPWILHKNDNLYKVFIKFIEFLCNKDDVNIQTADFFCRAIRNSKLNISG